MSPFFKEGGVLSKRSFFACAWGVLVESDKQLLPLDSTLDFFTCC